MSDINEFSAQEILNRVFDSTNNRLSIGGNVRFPATQVASTDANVLDDYEEGTWTPVLVIATPGTGVTYAANGQVGRYVKIGKWVNIQFQIITTSIGAGSGSLTVTGLPFTTENTANLIGGFHVTEAIGLAITAGMSVAARTRWNDAFASLLLWDSTVGFTELQASEWTDDGDVAFVGGYLAAA